MRKILVAGTRSGAGKTTVSMALMAAFENVAPFKVGPDYIDPGFHAAVTGNRSYNLDIHLCGEETVKAIFCEKSAGKEIAIVEGVMGLYDGIDNSLENGSSAHISRILGLPVILVVDGSKAAASVAAEVLGFKVMDGRVNIAGVIFNNLGGEKHYEILKEAVTLYTNIETLGYLPKKSGLGMTERHLGLVAAEEADLTGKTAEMRELALKHLNIARIYEIAETGREVTHLPNFGKEQGSLCGMRIAVARDRAFSFYYNSNLDLLKFMGAELIEFSPVDDTEIPEKTDLLYLGGGYPELWAEKLAGNKRMKGSIAEFYKKGGRIYGECGGFIYLTRGLYDCEGNFHEFCNIFDIEIKMGKKLNIKRFGYVDIDNGEGVKICGHEFHYSDILRNGEEQTIFEMKKRDGRSWSCGYRKKNVIAGYQHVDFNGNIDFLKWIFGKEELKCI